MTPGAGGISRRLYHTLVTIAITMVHDDAPWISPITIDVFNHISKYGKGSLSLCMHTFTLTVTYKVMHT